MTINAILLTETTSTTLSLELILSIIAIVISVVVAIVEYLSNKKYNVLNLEAEIYKTIFFDYLIKEIPQGRQYIHYNNEKLSDTDKLTDALNNLRRDSLFFKYKDKDFYDKIKTITQELEDLLVKSEDGTMDIDSFIAFTKELNEKMESLYSCIMNKYSGQK